MISGVLNSENHLKLLNDAVMKLNGYKDLFNQIQASRKELGEEFHATHAVLQSRLQAFEGIAATKENLEAIKTELQYQSSQWQAASNITDNNVLALQNRANGAEAAIQKLDDEVKMMKQSQGINGGNQQKMLGLIPMKDMIPKTLSKIEPYYYYYSYYYYYQGCTW